jgi:hypothetical protein
MAKDQIKIGELIPDDLNANKGTDYGGTLIENSLKKFGAGRSILLDKNNRIIAGNKTVENAAQIGLDDIIVVETTGRQIVAVKRMDIDLNSAEGREMALADNATAKANIDWDEDTIQKISEDWDINASDWGVLIEDNEDYGKGYKEKEIEEELETQHECPRCSFKW